MTTDATGLSTRLYLSEGESTQLDNIHARRHPCHWRAIDFGVLLLWKNIPVAQMASQALGWPEKFAANQ